MPVVRRVMPRITPEAKALRVAAYARVSSGKDAMLQSLSAQVSYFSEYIQNHPGWEFAGVYADEARTGTKDDRPEFQRLLQDCRDRKIDMIITKAVSRFARNTVTLLQTTRELKALGVTVFFEKEGLYSDRGQGELILSLLATVAQEESRTVSENCKWRIHSKFKAGELANLRFMYGYRIRKGKVEIESREAAVVAGIFDRYLAGTGCEAIAKGLQEQNTPTLNGGNWTPNRIMRILKNEKYAGNALLQKRYIIDHLTKKEARNQGQLPRYFVEGSHPAIVNIDVYERTQQLIEENRIRNNIALKAPASRLLSGKIACGFCGKPFTRVTRRVQAKWQCGTYLRQGRDACPAKQIPEDTLLALVSGVLGLNDFDPNIFDSRIERMLVVGPNTVRFVFKGGKEADVQWQDRSRRDSWTDEMKQNAREQMLRKGQ